MTLNPAQAQAVGEPIDTTLKILAGAGAGKTRVLVERYLKFVFDDGVSPDRLLALTFTKKAAAEMHERIFKEVIAREDKAALRSLYNAWIMNFHQFAFRVIKENAALFGIDPDFNVASAVDLARLKKRLEARFEAGTIPGTPETYADDMPAPNDMEGFFERCRQIVEKARQELWTPEELVATIREDDLPGYERYVQTVNAVWLAWEEDLHARHLLDFSDLIRIVVAELAENPSLRKHYANRFQHILVDEFQDTSEAQNRLLKLLSGETFPRVTVVGDEKQSIYRWRDARVENIREFAGSESFLTTNYRSTQGILDLAYHVLIEDAYFKEKAEEIRLEAARGAGGAITVFHPADGVEPSPAEEAKALGAWVQAITKEADGTPLALYTGASPRVAYEEVAILLRTLKPSSGLPHYEEELKRLGIPYAILGGVSRLDEQVLEQFRNLLTLLIQPTNARAFLSVVEGSPFDLPDKALHELLEKKAKRFDIVSVLSDESLGALSGARVRERLTALREALEDLAHKRAQLDLAAFVTECMEYTQFFYRLFAEGADLRIVDSITKRVLELVDQLGERNEANLATFLEAMHTLLDKKQFTEEDAPYIPEGRVVIMTLHQAKGLQFKAVAIPGIKNNPRSGESFYLERGTGICSSYLKTWGRGTKDCNAANRAKEESAQEERCLLYVAVTRAKDHVFLSTPFPGGIDNRKRENLFASVLRALKDNEIAHDELREVAPVDATLGSGAKARESDADLPQLLDVWQANRERVDEARVLASPAEPGLHFVSWRGLRAYRRCPQEYCYRYIANLRPDALEHETPREVVEDGDGEIAPEGIEPGDFGSLVHRYLYEWMRALDDVREPPKELAQDLATRFGLRGDIRDRAADAVISIANRFNKHVTWAMKDVCKLEWPIQLRTGNLVLHGVVDRVDKTDDGYRIVDYKVGQPREEYEDQLRFYARIVSVLFEREAISGVIAYLRRDASIVDVDVSGATLAHVASSSERLEESIRTGVFHASPGVVCESCDFRGVCPDAVS